MIKRKSTFLAWILFAVVAISAVISGARIMASHGAYPSIFVLIQDIGWELMALVFAFMGAFIISHQPGQVIGWLLLAPAYMALATTVIEGTLERFPTPPAEPGITLILAVWFSNWSWLMLMFPLLFIMLLFPTGKPPTPRWRWVLYGGLFMAGFLIFIATFAPILSLVDDPDWAIANPIGFLPTDFEFPDALWAAGLVILTLSCVASLIVRYRRARGVERQQMKWLFYACGLFGVLYLLDGSDWPTPFLNDLWNIIFTLSIMAIPTAIAVAILRYRLYDIDVIIRKTLIYSVVTGLLALVYLGLVVLLQEVFAQLSGEQSPIAIVISTLVIAALFVPLRRRVQDVIDRRFYRSKYDAAQALATFSKTARDEVDLERLATTLVGLVHETMQPEQVTLWLKGSEVPQPERHSPDH